MTVDTPYYDFTLLDENQACYNIAFAASATTSKTVALETHFLCLDTLRWDRDDEYKRLTG